MIIRHFVHNDNYPLISVLIISVEKNEGKPLGIFVNANPFKLKKMSYLEFADWFEEAILEYWKYIQTHDFYGVRFLINPLLTVEAISTIPQPVYPWAEDEVTLLYTLRETATIANLKNENIKLKKELETLKKK